mgnify:FL=1
MGEKLQIILEKFGLEADAKPYGNGHINDTYILADSKHILQKINTNIFKNPDELMQNILNVTEFLKKKIGAQGGDTERETLTVVKTTDGKLYYEDENGEVYRVYKFVERTRTVESAGSEDDLYQAGVAFGHFQKLLSDFPVEKLYETIKDFHHTPKRVEALKAAIAEDKAGRASSVQKEIEFALDFAKDAAVVVDGMADGSISMCVTHNDTKINNILFEEDSSKAVCIIDLDTVMPGSLLYDVGDALRVGGSTAAEDETDLGKVHFNEKAFEAFAKGYLSEVKDVLTEKELELLPFGVRLMTYECGIRFLTDYLNGDTYFKIHREHHNLDRARNQFKLVADLAAKEEGMKAFVRSL